MSLLDLLQFDIFVNNPIELFNHFNNLSDQFELMILKQYNNNRGITN